MLTNKMLHGHKTYSVHIYASQPINKIAEKKRRIHYVYIYTHCVPKKGATKLMAVTSSNLNRFSPVVGTNYYKSS